MAISKADYRRIGISLVVVLAGVIFAAFLAAGQTRRNELELRNVFMSRGQSVVDAIMNQFRNYERGLSSTRGMVAGVGSEELTREQFHRYRLALDLREDFPGARGVGLIRRVLPQNLDDFMRRARADGAPSFEIRQTSPNHGERWVVQYIEPLASNRGAYGFDIASDAALRDAAWNAMISNSAAITAPITIEQVLERPEGSFLLLLPFYKGGMPLESPQQREAALAGWAYAPLVAAEVLQNLLRLPVIEDRIAFTMRDTTGGTAATQFFQTDWTTPNRLEGMRVPKLTVEKQIFGRNWVLEIQPTPIFAAELKLTRPLDVFGWGSAAAGLLGLLFYAILWGRSRHQEQLSLQRRMSVIVQNSNDAIISASRDDRILTWNTSAENLFGYGASDAIGRRVSELIVPDQLRWQEDDVLARTLQGDRVMPFDTVRCRRDGTEIHVSITASPLVDIDGKIIGYSKILRDIGEKAAMQQQLQRFNEELEHQVEVRAQELDEARRHLEKVIDAVPSLISYWDLDLVCRVANRAHFDWFHIDSSGMVGRSMREIFTDEGYQQLRPQVEKALRGDIYHEERQISSADAKAPRHADTWYLPDIVDGQVQGLYIVGHDISERVTQTRELQQREAALKSISHLARIGGWSLDGPSGKISGDEELGQILGASRDQIQSMDDALRLHPEEDRERIQQAIGKAIREGSGWDEIVRVTPSDGQIKWVRAVGSARQDGSLFGFLQDITEQQQAEAERADEQRRLEYILRGTNLGTWEWNLQTGEVRVNERLLEISGSSPDATLTMPANQWLAMLHPDDALNAQSLIEQHILGNFDFYRSEHRIRHQDGRWIWVADRGKVFSWTEDGSPEWIYGTRQDVTTRREAERKLADSEAFLVRTGHIAHVGGWRTNVQTGEVHWTDEMRELFEVPANFKPTNEEVAKFVAPGSARYVHEAIIRTQATGDPWDLEMEIITGKGNHRWIRTAGRLETERDGRGQAQQYLIGVNQDITEQRAAAIALKEATEAARAASNAKSEFLANMSHEIRTPMNAVMGVSHLLQSTTLDQRQQELVGKLQVAGRALLGVINDVLDFAKIEAGEMQLDIQPYRLDELLAEIPTLMGPAVEAKQLALHVECDAALPANLLGDSQRLRQILLNLVSNAVKFTKQGSITVRAELLATGTATDTPMIRLAVRDTGIGISPEVLGKLFSPFTQADSSTTRMFGGTGLGLSIVRRLAMLMGGEAGVTSEPGVGSEFWVKLPCQAAEAAATSSAQRGDAALGGDGSRCLSGMRVLLVDDSDINRDIGRQLLELQGAVVQERGNGLEALTLLQQAPDAFDVVLMDVQMPVMDGLEATRQARSTPALASLPIIALTAGALAEERQRATEAGMNAFVTKPLEPQTLFRAMRRVVEARTGEAWPIDAPRDGAAATAASEATALPTINGIDAREAASRFGTDAKLFLSALGRVLRENADLCGLSAACIDTGSDREQWMARLHKLRGSAGLLGATHIHRLAGEAEDALRRGEPSATVQALLGETGEQLDQLRHALQAFSDSQPAAPAADGAATLDPAKLTELLGLLQRNDLGALELFASIAASVHAAWGDAASNGLREAIEGLDFGRAAILLREQSGTQHAA